MPRPGFDWDDEDGMLLPPIPSKLDSPKKNSTFPGNFAGPDPDAKARLFLRAQNVAAAMKVAQQNKLEAKALKEAAVANKHNFVVSYEGKTLKFSALDPVLLGDIVSFLNEELNLPEYFDLQYQGLLTPTQPTTHLPSPSH